MISNIRYWFLLFLILLVYVAGLFVALFERDSAQFAVMAMHMVQENDYFNLLVGSEPYLDKPHLHFWLTAFSFKIFGISDWAYRIPSLLATFLAAYSCFGLGKRLYNLKVGKLAALVFLTTQIIVISNTDVRYDALLTAFVIFAIWQFVIYFEKGSLIAIVLGSIGAGLAFSTSGLTALLFIIGPLFCHLIYTRKWKRLFSWRILFALLLFCISIIPVFYAYYLQWASQSGQLFENHGFLSKVTFFLKEQTFVLFNEAGVGFGSFDFFFFKSFLWTFLPWTIIGLLAYLNRFKSMLKLNFATKPKFEFLSLGGISLLFLVFLFIPFKTHQYLDPLIPLFSILVASYLYRLNRFRSDKTIKTILALQYFIFGLVFVASVLICYYVFKVDNSLNYIWMISLAILAIFYSLKREGYFHRLITVSVLCSLMINAVLNTHFFPNLLKHKAGNSMAEVIEEKKIEAEPIYKLSDQGTWALEFYSKKRVEKISITKILNKQNIWVYADELQLRELHNLGYDWDRQYQVEQFRMSQLNLKFLDPAARKSELTRMYLIHIY